MRPQICAVSRRPSPDRDSRLCPSYPAGLMVTGKFSRFWQGLIPGRCIEWYLVRLLPMPMKGSSAPMVIRMSLFADGGIIRPRNPMSRRAQLYRQDCRITADAGCGPTCVKDKDRDSRACSVQPALLATS